WLTWRASCYFLLTGARPISSRPRPGSRRNAYGAPGGFVGTTLRRGRRAGRATTGGAGAGDGASAAAGGAGARPETSGRAPSGGGYDAGLLRDRRRSAAGDAAPAAGR